MEENEKNSVSVQAQETVSATILLIKPDTRVACGMYQEKPLLSFEVSGGPLGDNHIKWMAICPADEGVAMFLAAEFLKIAKTYSERTKENKDEHEKKL